MKYIAHLFLSMLPYTEEEVRYINGEKQVCLILPTKINQLKKSSRGNWIMTCVLADVPPNAKMITHNVELRFLSREEVDKARAQGYYHRTTIMGRIRELDCTKSKKVDRRNKATDFRCDGIIILSDIPKQYIFRNSENNKRYLNNVCFRPVVNNGYIYTGFICIDDMPIDDIKTDPNTGKKYINTRFKKLKQLDTYMNTHELVIVTNTGDEIEIGRFKEWVAQNRQTPPTNQNPPTEPVERPINQQPDSINGIRF